MNFMVEERISNECKNKIHSLPFCISSIGDLHDIVIQLFSQSKVLFAGEFPRLPSVTHLL